MQSTTVICFAFVCLFGAMVSTGSALPQDSVLTDETAEYVRALVDLDAEDEQLLEPVVEGEEEQGHYRQKRATCDLLSGFGVQDSACAAHCIARRFRGGYCNSQKVCVCRN